MSTYIVLMNPISGTFESASIRTRVTELLSKLGHSYTIIETDAETGAKYAAAEALKAKSDGIIVCGGDGTIFEVINVVHGSGTPLMLVPCGTGNDFFRMLGLPKDPIDALEIQLKSKPRKIDIGRVNDYRFMNVSGTGFDVDVLKAVDKYKKKYTGLKPYLYGLIEAIRNYKPISCKMTIDEDDTIEAKCAIISIGNGRYFGGGMKAVPTALIDDGFFDLVMVKPVPKLFVLPLVFFFIMGLHEKIGLAKIRKCKKVIIEHSGMTVNMDGELRESDRAEYELVHNGILLQIP